MHWNDCIPRVSHRLYPALLFCVFVVQHQASPQTLPTVSAPTYDAISIVPDKADSGNMVFHTQASEYSATNALLKTLLSFAFGIREDLISGLPPWTASARFDIRAKIVDPDLPTLKQLTDKQRNAMLADILRDRFGLRTHTEVRQLPVYNLIISSRGTKLTPSVTQDESKATWSNNGNELTGTTISMASLIDMLSNELHRTIIDKTQLTSFYDVHLRWAPEQLTAPGSDNGQLNDGSPSLFLALNDQLGLKLVPAKGPVSTLVVDHIEHPTPN